MSDISYIPDQPAAKVHAFLQRSLTVMDNAHKCSVLWFGEVRRRRLFRDLGHSSINQYAAQELGFSKSRADDFIRLAKLPRRGKSFRWPPLKLRTHGWPPPR